MGKVSIGLRGWRFDEEEVFTEAGELRPMAELPEETRQRLARLTVVVGSPCDACWLIHGDENVERCNVASVVYGEPLNEVVLCEDHEPDFLYWFREAGGSRFRGDERFEDEFHEWFLDGGRAPEGYAGLEHVDTAPDALPASGESESVPALEDELAEMDDEERAALDVDFSDLEL